MEEETRHSRPPAEEPPAGDPRTEPDRSWPAAPSRDRGKLVAFGAMGALVAVGVALLAFAPKAAPPPGASLSLTSSGEAPQGAAKEAARDGAAAASAPIAERLAPAWRVSQLKSEPGIAVAEGTFGRRGLVASLTQAGVERAEIKRLARSFEGVRKIDRQRESDAFVVAWDKATGALVAFEFITSAADVWQARSEGPRGEGALVAKKLELFVERRRVATPLVVSADLPKAIEAAGMRAEIALAVDDALEGHIESSAMRAGVRMRVVAAEEWVEGVFARGAVEAIEFVPTSGKPLRIYYYERDTAEVNASPRSVPLPGFYDARGRQPFKGLFRSPVALARVTSRYNPKRMHPVLKVVKPHNGIDFGGAPGTPVYASGAGTVASAGNAGPCGNMVAIDHAGGIRTLYCHLKGFASGLRAGQKVEARQLIGYIGQTGRVTGPHLHFAVKKNGGFIDPAALKMDGVRVLPPPDRDAFARKRAELDALIDGVPLPSAANVPDEPEDVEHFHDD